MASEYGYTLAVLETMTIRQIEIWHDETVKRNARRDLRMLDLIIAPHVADAAANVRDLRARLLDVATHGCDAGRESPEEKTPDQWRDHNRAQFALLRVLTQTPTESSPPDAAASGTIETEANQ